MTRRTWMISGIAAAFVAVASLAGLAVASSERSDCPGKIICPLTGKLVCKDKCPARDASRPDCPGQIVCPQTGELVCKDRCPLNQAQTAPSGAEPAANSDLPPCCRKGT